MKKKKKKEICLLLLVQWSETTRQNLYRIAIEAKKIDFFLRIFQMKQFEMSDLW